MNRIYTPTSEEIKFARKSTRGSNSTLYFLVKMKTFRRLGYFVPINDIPKRIIRHIASKLNIGKVPNLFQAADKIRGYYSITPFDDKGREIAVTAIHEASRTKEDLPDIINVCIEELVRHKYELPAFSNLQRLAFAGRAHINDQLYSEINNHLDDSFKTKIRDLFLVNEGDTKSSWHYLKSEPKKLTLTNLKDRIVCPVDCQTVWNNGSPQQNS